MSDIPAADTSHAPLPPAELARRQELSRRSMRRANTAVALALGTVLVLAFGAVWQSHRAAQMQAAAQAQQGRAESAEADARMELQRALLAEARATRQSPRLDRREATLDIIRRAAALGPTPELRDQAVATLALPEYRLEAHVSMAQTAQRYAFDTPIRRCALVLTNGDIVVRRFVDGAEERRLPRRHPGIPGEQGVPVLLEFSPGGDDLAVRYAGGALAVWSLPTATPRFVRDADVFRRMASHARFSSDGRHLVAPVFTPDGFAVMETDTGREVAHFTEPSSFRHAAVRPGRAHFAADLGSMIAVFDWSTGQRIAEFPFPAGARALAWSADGAHLAIGGHALEVEVWNLDTLQVRRLPGHQDDVYDLAFDTTGARLATSSLDGSSRIWDLRDGRLLALATDRRLVTWGPDGRSGWSVIGDRLEVRFDPRGAVHERLAGIPGQSDGQTFDLHPDGDWAVSRDQDGTVWQWHLTRATGPERTPLRTVDSLCIDPHGPALLFTRAGGLEAAPLSRRPPGDRQAWSIGVPQLLTAVPNRRVNLMTTSPDGGARAYVELAAGAVWADLRIPGAPAVRIEGALHSSVDRRSGSARGTGTVALSHDGRWLACGADGVGGTRVFDTRTGQPAAYLHDDIGGVQFSADGRWLVLATARACHLFRVGDWQRLWSIAAVARHANYAATAALSPDGNLLAYAESTRHLALLDVATGRRLATLESPGASPVVALRWNANGTRLVSFTRENAVEVWHLPALQDELARLGLDWRGAPASPAPLTAALPTGTAPRFPTWVAVGVLGTAGLVALIAMLSLQRHRRLVEDYAEAEELAARRQHELTLEREISQLKSSFVSMVSHEFRTPLQVTLSAVELLRNYLDRLPVAKRAELLEDIYRSTLRMSGLMEQVLLLGRAESGRLGCRTAPMNLPELLARLLDEAQSATERRCQLRCQQETPLEGAQGDEALLRHILSNLISNAVKYSPPGAEVVVTARRDGDDAVMTVRDHGIGIPVADQERLFEAFHRGGNVGQTPGTGLGLLIVKRCVDLHGGHVAVESTENLGTTFTLRLPLFGNTVGREAGLEESPRSP